jgi:hypothetical protein
VDQFSFSHRDVVNWFGAKPLLPSLMDVYSECPPIVVMRRARSPLASRCKGILTLLGTRFEPLPWRGGVRLKLRVEVWRCLKCDQILETRPHRLRAYPSSRALFPSPRRHR